GPKDLHHVTSDFRPAPSGFQTANRCAEYFPSHIHQSSAFGIDFADGIGPGGISTPAVHPASGIDTDNVSRLQNIRAGDAMHDSLVNADARHCRKWNLAGKILE